MTQKLILTALLLAGIILSMCSVNVTLAQPDLVYPVQTLMAKTLASAGLAAINVPQASQIKLVDVVKVNGPLLTQDNKPLQLPASEAKSAIRMVLDAYAVRTGNTRYLGISDIQVTGQLIPNANPTNPNIYTPIIGQVAGVTSISLSSGSMCNPVGSNEEHNTFHVIIFVPTDSDPINADVIFLPGSGPINREPALAMFVTSQNSMNGVQQWY
jgi:hypothetical protein